MKGVLGLCQGFAFGSGFFLEGSLWNFRAAKFHQGKDPIKASREKTQFQKPNPREFFGQFCVLNQLEKPPRQWDEVLMGFFQILGLVTPGIALAVNHCN